MKVVVDFDLCESNAVCMGIAPEVFEVREDDFLYVLDEHPPEELRPKLEQWEKLCADLGEEPLAEGDRPLALARQPRGGDPEVEGAVRPRHPGGREALGAYLTQLFAATPSASRSTGSMTTTGPGGAC